MQKNKNSHIYIRKSIKILSPNYRFRDGIIKIDEKIFFYGDLKWYSWYSWDILVIDIFGRLTFH